MRVAIKKGTEDNNVFSGYSGSDKTEEKRSVEVLSSGNLEKAIESLDYLMENNYKTLGVSINYDDLILTPIEISTLVGISHSHKENPFFNNNFSEFFNRLIKVSYKAGNNNFNLDLTETPFICEIVKNFKAEKERPLKLNIIGELGSRSCKYSSNIDLNVIGVVGYDFGKYSIDINLTVEGKVKNNFGNSSKGLIVKVNGSVGTNFGEKSKHLTTVIKGSVDAGFGFESSDMIASIYGNIPSFILLNANNSIIFAQDKARISTNLSDNYLQSLNSRGNQIISGERVLTHSKYKQLQRIIEREYQ